MLGRPSVIVAEATRGRWAASLGGLRNWLGLAPSVKTRGQLGITVLVIFELTSSPASTLCRTDVQVSFSPNHRRTIPQAPSLKLWGL